MAVGWGWPSCTRIRTTTVFTRGLGDFSGAASPGTPEAPGAGPANTSNQRSPIGLTSPTQKYNAG